MLLLHFWFWIRLFIASINGNYFSFLFYLAIRKIELTRKASLTDHVTFSNGFDQQK